MKLKDLENRGVIKKVTTPTDWISSMLTVKKTGKLRIYIDPRDLNKAIKRSHYILPTLEDILPNLAKAKVLSVLDAKEGFGISNWKNLAVFSLHSGLRLVDIDGCAYPLEFLQRLKNSSVDSMKCLKD